MLIINIISNISIFLLILIGISCNNNSQKNYLVTFKITVISPTEEQKVFITGNQPELGNWEPGEVLMDRINDSSFIKTFSFSEGTHLAIKFSAGHWWTEALNKDENLYDNLELVVEKDTVVSVVVYDWKNTFVNDRVVLNQKRFQPNRTIMVIDDFWKYHPGDNLDWAKENFDDSSWETIESYINLEENPDLKWDNIGWFRFHFIADSSLWNKSLALLIGHLGASQIYYNGGLLYSFGEIGTSAESFKPVQNRLWKEIEIEPKHEQLIAIRYANYNWKEHKNFGFPLGFTLYLKDINTIFQLARESILEISNHQMVFTLIPLILFFLHFFIFSFNTKQKENLFYAVCLLGFAGITYFSFEKYISTNPGLVILDYQLNGVSVPVSIFFGLLTSFAILYNKIPKRWMFYFFPFIIISLINYYFPLNRTIGIINYIYIGITITDIIISSFKGTGKKNQKGGWIVFTGFIIMSFFVVIQVLLDFSVIPPLTVYNQVFVYGMIGFAISMSLYLSYNFAQTNKNLEAQLMRVRELSEKTLEQERTAGRLELERKIVEAENKRKTQELEEARKLQLSLLPKEIPDSENLDIAFYMNTATEVGGDYYDIISGEDKRITIAVGDATGHGVKAGIMVAIVKGLIHELSNDLKSSEVLEKINNVIREMQLGNLYMALILIKINKSCIDISSAGMPPILLYKREENIIEEIIIKRMPLGATNKLNFPEQKIKINSGDILLLLSDGLLELFNQKMEMFDYKRVKEVLLNNTGKTSAEIITELKSAAERWRGGFEPSDDMTFVVVKCKE